MTRAPAASGLGTLAARYRDVRALTVSLAEGLTPEDCALQSMPDASPARWHLAHTTWFFETFVLAAATRDYVPVHPAYGHLFNSYYVSVGDPFPRARRGLLSRPTLAEILEYRGEVDLRMDALLARGDDLEREGLLPAVTLGLHHEQQHQELILTDLLHLFSLNPLDPVYRAPKSAPAERARALSWLPFEGGVREIGWEGDGFAYDNEGPRHRVYLEPFEMADRPVTNGEYLSFVEDGGYRRADLWLSEGWAAVESQVWSAPLHWRKLDAARTQMTLGGPLPLDLAAPVTHVSFFEADAYARWARARLPTEAEWETLASDRPVEGRFLEDGWLRPVAAPRGGGPLQVFGDVWEWTSSAYAPYPGYRPPAGPIGEYNGKFMSSQYVLRGGSCATPRGHVRPTYRNYFPPSARWQFSGIRLAR